MSKEISYEDDFNYTVFDKPIEKLAERFNIKNLDEVRTVLNIMKDNDITNNGIEFLNIYDIYVAEELTDDEMFNLK